MGHSNYRVASMPVKGVLFDMDGVVVDTEKLYARFWQEAANALGYPMTYTQALGMRSLNRQAGQEKLESYFGPGIDIHEVRAIRIERMEAYIDAHGVEPKPGIYELLDFLDQKGIPAAITTSSPQERVKKYLQPLGLYHRFAHICTGYEVAHGKPEPDIYLYGAESLGLPPENCLAIEDSPAGILSAYRAGCMPVLVPDLDGADDAMGQNLYAEADSLLDIMELIG